MEGWELGLLAVGGYVAAVALVRLMMARQRALLKDLTDQAEQAARQRAKQEREAKRRARRGA